MPRVLCSGEEPTLPRSVFLCTQTVDNKVDVGLLSALWGAKEFLESRGIGAYLEILSENCHVDDGRNILVRDFLETNCTDMVFLDSDLEFSHEALYSIIKPERDVVAGIYPLKQDEGGWPVVLKPGPRYAEPDGLLEVWAVPTGFLRISRHCLETLWSESHQFKARGDTPNKKPIGIIFERLYVNNERTGGDYAFCLKWRGCHGKIYIAPEVALTHIGVKGYSGRYGDWLCRASGLDTMGFQKAIQNLKDGNPQYKDFEDLFVGCGNPFSVGPDFLHAIYMMAKEVGGPILETGSGLSTIVLAAAGAEVVSLENDLKFYRTTVECLDRNDLSATVLYAPISQKTNWYDIEKLPVDPKILLCDGPQRCYDRSYLYKTYLKDIQDAVWVVDDMDDMNIVNMINEFKGGKTISIYGDNRKWGVVT